MAGKTSWPSSTEYSTTKTAIIGLTRAVAMDLAPLGVTVNAVCPGHVETDMMRNVAKTVVSGSDQTAEEWLVARAAENPMGRFAEPWEIAGLITFLASDDARYSTGQAIEIDGGHIMS